MDQACRRRVILYPGGPVDKEMTIMQGDRFQAIEVLALLYQIMQSLLGRLKTMLGVRQKFQTNTAIKFFFFCFRCKIKIKMFMLK